MTALGDIVREQKREQAERKFREKFKDDSHRILEYTPGQGGDIRSKPRYRFLCTCGKEDEREYRGRCKYPLLCLSCNAKLRQVTPTAMTLEQVRFLFQQHCATLLNHEYTGAKQRLFFHCGCGKNDGFILARNAIWPDPRTGVLTPPRCKPCTKAFKRQVGEQAAQHLPHPAGTDHHNWNPDLTNEDRTHNKYGRPAAAAKWYRQIFKRDHYTCQITGKVNTALAAHHIYPWAQHPARRYDLHNGITITRELHVEFHRQHGNDCTYLQFRDFVEQLTGKSCPIPDPYPEETPAINEHAA